MVLFRLLIIFTCSLNLLGQKSYGGFSRLVFTEKYAFWTHGATGDYSSVNYINYALIDDKIDVSNSKKIYLPWGAINDKKLSFNAIDDTLYVIAQPRNLFMRHLPERDPDLCMAHIWVVPFDKIKEHNAPYLQDDASKLPVYFNLDNNGFSYDDRFNVAKIKGTVQLMQVTKDELKFHNMSYPPITAHHSSLQPFSLDPSKFYDENGGSLKFKTDSYKKAAIEKITLYQAREHQIKLTPSGIFSLSGFKRANSRPIEIINPKTILEREYIMMLDENHEPLTKIRIDRPIFQLVVYQYEGRYLIDNRWNNYAEGAKDFARLRKLLFLK